MLWPSTQSPMQNHTSFKEINQCTSNYLEDDKIYYCICTCRAVGGVRRTPVLSISVGIDEVDFFNKRKLEDRR
jgi:hypothetical protein